MGTQILVIALIAVLAIGLGASPVMVTPLGLKKKSVELRMPLLPEYTASTRRTGPTP